MIGGRVVIRLRAPARAFGCVSALIAILAVCGAVAGAAGLMVAALLVLFGIPISGFTYGQWKATSRGLQLAQSVDDIQALKDTDAAAFTQPITALRRVVRVGGELQASRTDAPEPDAMGEPGAAGTALAPPTGGSGNFWQALSPTERDELLAIAQHVIVPAGHVLWRTGELGEHVVLLQSGRTMISDRRRGVERIIAFRGPGELIGERAALRRSLRSATVVAVEVVHALRIATDDFNAFVGAHPRLLQVIEDKVYERLTETAEPAWTGQNCSILLIDVAGFGSKVRDEGDRWLVRQKMYAIVHQAWALAGMAWRDCHHEDRGDGMLIVVPPSTPTDVLTGPLLAGLATLLRDHNSGATAGVRIQLRLALNVGPVVSDAEGVSGDAIIYAARMLEASALKRRISGTGSDVGFITSGFVYDTVVKRPVGYRRVVVRVKEARTKAWIRLVTAEPEEQSA
jgi:hypothetical protein